jgi:hypothetical protein
VARKLLDCRVELNQTKEAEPNMPPSPEIRPAGAAMTDGLLTYCAILAARSGLLTAKIADSDADAATSLPLRRLAREIAHVC